MTGGNRTGGGLLFLTVASSLLVSVLFPPVDLGVLAWVCLSPLLFAFRRGGLPAAAGHGFLFGCLYFCGAFYWLLRIEDFNLLDFLLMSLLFGLYYMLFGLLYRMAGRRFDTWLLVVAPALWVAFEYLRSNLFFLALPWNLLAHSQHRYLPVIQVACVTGVYGVSFLIVMVNQCLSEIPDRLSVRNASPKADRSGRTPTSRRFAREIVVATALAAALAYGFFRVAAPYGDRSLRVALVQSNRVTRDNMTLAEQGEHLGKHRELSLQAAREKPDLIVWPASSLPATVTSRVVRMSLFTLARETGCYLLVGGAGHEKDRPPKEGDLPYSNSEFLYSPEGRREGQYDKIRLLPFNEYLPLQGILRWPSWITTLKDSFIPGTRYTLFRVRDAAFGAPICWENLFPALFRRFLQDGANLMVSVTNEAFFRGGPGPYQTLAMNVFRAVENGVAVARSATTGISCFIGPDGRILGRVRGPGGEDLDVAGVLVMDLPLASRRTFYTRYGDLFAFVAIALATAFVVASSFGPKNPVPGPGD